MTSMDFSDMFKSDLDIPLGTTDSIHELSPITLAPDCTSSEHKDVVSWITAKVEELGMNLSENDMSEDVINILKSLLNEVPISMAVSKFILFYACHSAIIGYHNLMQCQQHVPALKVV